MKEVATTVGFTATSCRVGRGDWLSFEPSPQLVTLITSLFARKGAIHRQRATCRAGLGVATLPRTHGQAKPAFRGGQHQPNGTRVSIGAAADTTFRQSAGPRC